MFRVDGLHKNSLTFVVQITSNTTNNLHVANLNPSFNLELKYNSKKKKKSPTLDQICI
jgi:hypothetical protein